MEAITITHILELLSLAAIFYALWVVYYFEREKRKPGNKSSNEESSFLSLSKKKKDIVGKSTFILTDRKIQQNTAKETDVEEDTKKESTFVESNVQEHPKQVPSDELDEVFGKPPEGEDNSPMEVEIPLDSINPFPENNEDEDEADTEEDEDEDLPLRGESENRPKTIGTKFFEEMGEAYAAVVHDPPLTDDEKEDTGRILLEMKHTDMFEAMVSGQKERENKVSYLIDTYLTAFHQKMQTISGESPTLQGIPSDFDMRRFL